MDIDVGHIGRLACLDMKDSEVKALQPQLQKILEYIAQIEGVETEGVTPTSHVVVHDMVPREDNPGPELSSEQAFENAAAHDGEMYVVPKVV